jgi:NAD(P)H dehydrogenase (quinone)
MAEATANILLSDNHVGKVYRFTNSESFSYHEVAQILGDISKKDMKYISPTVEDFSSTLKGFGVPDSIIGLTAGFAIAQAQGELEEVGNDLENLLGRKPTTVRAFLNQIM